MTEEKYWDIWDNISEVRFGSYQDMPGEDDELGYADKPWEGPSYDEPDEPDETYIEDVLAAWHTFCRMSAKVNKTATAEDFTNYMMILNETDIMH